ncbi:MAG TPA: hypothetical protein VIT92_15155 [Burkholderiaceae bacterium]
MIQIYTNSDYALDAAYERVASRDTATEGSKFAAALANAGAAASENAAPAAEDVRAPEDAIAESGQKETIIDELTARVEGLLAAARSAVQSTGLSGASGVAAAVTGAAAGKQDAAEVSPAVTAPVNDFADLIAESQAAAVSGIPPDEQNVVNSSMRSKFAYTTNKHATDNTLWQLEDGLRRTTDMYDAAVANAKGYFAAAELDGKGERLFITREQEIQAAKDKMAGMREAFEQRKAFENDPAAMTRTEIAYQVKHGVPSTLDVKLSAADARLVEERRAGAGAV